MECRIVAASARMDVALDDAEMLVGGNSWQDEMSLAFAYSYYDYEGWTWGEPHFVGPLKETIEWAIEEAERGFDNIDVCVVEDGKFVPFLQTFYGLVQCEDEPQFACMAVFLGAKEETYYLWYANTGRKAVESPIIRLHPRIDEMEKLTVEEVVERAQG